MSSFKINEAYANKYNRWRGLEELQKSNVQLSYLFSTLHYLLLFLIFTVADRRKREGIESTDDEDNEDESSSSEESVCLLYFYHVFQY